MDGWADGWIGWMDRLGNMVYGWMDWMDGWKDRMNGKMVCRREDGWMDGMA